MDRERGKRWVGRAGRERASKRVRCDVKAARDERRNGVRESSRISKRGQ